MENIIEKYSEEHCNHEKKEYVNEILIIKPEALYEEYQAKEYQLWLATHGTGCFSWCTSMSDTIHAVCLSDDDYGAFSRDNFIGVAKEETLPEWAKEKRNQLLNDNTQDNEEGFDR